MADAAMSPGLIAVLLAGLPNGPGTRAGDARTLAVEVEGWRYFAGSPPARWTEPAFDDRGWAGPASGPFAPRQPPLPTPSPAGITFESEPGQPLLLRGRFTVADPSRARVLDLGVAYADAFIASVNGREVARRGMAGDDSPVAEFHGPEVEHVYIPIGSPALPALRTGDNLLAVAVFASPRRNTVVPSAPAAALALTVEAGVRIVRGPYLSAPAEDAKGAGLRVNWETDLPATGVVTVETAEGAPIRRLSADRRATRQSLRVRGLRRGTTYRYAVAVDAGGGDVAASQPARFQTLPAPPNKLRFVVYGDMRYPGHEAHRALVEALVRLAPPLIVNTGDLTDVGSEESNWQKYFEITAPLGAIAPVVPALGNHDADRRGLGAAKTWALFGVPGSPPPGWTSLELGGVHFVILSTNEMRDPAQLAWLVEDLARARRHHARAIFGFCHEGPWAHGLHGGSSVMAREYAPLLAAGHVDMLFCGHDHIYERGVGLTRAGPLPYVVTGGGGAPLYEPSCQVPARANGGRPAVASSGLPACPPSVAVLTKEYHYVVVEVGEDGIDVCPRRVDGSALEPCVHLRHALDGGRKKIARNR